MVVIALGIIFSFHSVKPIDDLWDFMQNPQHILLNDEYDNTKISMIVEKIINYMQQNQQLSDELSARIELLNATRYEALQLQINPHFLYNTLNMIRFKECELLGYNHSLPKITLNLSKLLR